MRNLLAHAPVKVRGEVVRAVKLVFNATDIEEARRRERVIRIFPNDDSALRMIGALLAEQNESWQERKYPDMDEFREWAATLAA